MSASLVFWGNILGATLMASLWQSVIVFTLLRLLLWITRDGTAAVRYTLSLGALTVLGLWFALTFYSRWQLQQQSLGYVWEAVRATTQAAGPAAPFSGHHVRDWGTLDVWLGLAYVVGLLASSGRMLRDVIWLNIIQRSRRIPFDEAWARYLDSLAAAWRITRHVAVYLSEKIDVPIVVGFFKPVIYLPLTLVSRLPETQIEAILLHELAHVKRMDFLVNILETVVETLLFFNPLVGWISRHIRLERELCCDELVISRTDPRTYASALVALEESRQTPGRLVMAASGDKNLLFYRIKRLMEMKTKKLNVSQKVAAALILVAGFFSVAWLSPAGATHPARSLAASRDTVLPQPAAAVGQGSMPPGPSSPVPAPPPVPVTPAAPGSPAAPPTAVIAFTNASLPRPARMIDSVPQPADSAVLRFSAAPRQGPGRAREEHFSFTPDRAAMQQMQVKMRRYADSLHAYFDSKDWHEQQQRIREQARAMADQMKAQDFRQYGEAARAMAEKMREQFHSDAWARQFDGTSTFRPRLDSVFSEVNRRLEHTRTMTPGRGMMYSFSGSGPHGVDPASLLSMMRSQGLIDAAGRHQIRIDQGQLVIDGKKQEARYGRQYQQMVGKNTQVVIKTHGSELKTQIKTRQ